MRLMDAVFTALLFGSMAFGIIACVFGIALTAKIVESMGEPFPPTSFLVTAVIYCAPVFLISPLLWWSWSWLLRHWPTRSSATEFLPHQMEQVTPTLNASESLFVLAAQDGSPILSISAKGKVKFAIEPTEAARVFADELERILKLRFPHCVKNEAVETGFAPSQAGRK